MHRTTCARSSERTAAREVGVPGTTRSSRSSRTAARSTRTRPFKDWTACRIGCTRSCDVGRPRTRLGHHHATNRSRRWCGWRRSSGFHRSFDLSGRSRSRGCRLRRSRSRRRGLCWGNTGAHNRGCSGLLLRSCSGWLCRRTRNHRPRDRTAGNRGWRRDQLRRLSRLRHHNAPRGCRRRCRGSRRRGRHGRRNARRCRLGLRCRRGSRCSHRRSRRWDHHGRWPGCRRDNRYGLTGLRHHHVACTLRCRRRCDAGARSSRSHGHDRTRRRANLRRRIGCGPVGRGSYRNRGARRGLGHSRYLAGRRRAARDRFRLLALQDRLQRIPRLGHVRQVEALPRIAGRGT